MNLKEIKELIKIFDDSSIGKLEIENGDFEIKLEKSGCSAAIEYVSAPIQEVAAVANAPKELDSSSSESQNSSKEYITSPMVGTFYRCPSPNAEPYVKAGDKIKKGQIVGIIEAMKIMNEIEAEFDCVIEEIITEDGQPIEYGSNLFSIKRA